MQYLDKEKIISAAENIFADLSTTCNNISAEKFFSSFNGKWSIAESVQHLIISTKTTTLAYTLPSFLVRWIGGTPTRPPRTYNELVTDYNTLLSKGAKASKRFTPKPIEIKYGKKKLLSNWDNATERFITALKNNTSETKLDNYFAKHPLLGKISLRALCYFTIYHTEHHLSIIKNRLEIN